MDLVSPRLATPDDLERIVAIERASYPNPWQAAHFLSEMEKPFAKLMVLTDDETDTVIFGYAVYWIHAEEVSLLNITVSPNWRGFGYARVLMQVMISEAVRDEIPKVKLEVRPSNERALKLYERVGFKTIHVRKNFYADGESAYLMELKTSELSGMIQ